MVPIPGPTHGQDGPAGVAARTGRSELGNPPGGVRRHLPLFQWSSPSLKDHLALFTHGVVCEWSIPKKTGRDYIEQMSAEVREEREGRLEVVPQGGNDREPALRGPVRGRFDASSKFAVIQLWLHFIHHAARSSRRTQP